MFNLNNTKAKIYGNEKKERKAKHKQKIYKVNGRMKKTTTAHHTCKQNGGEVLGGEFATN